MERRQLLAVGSLVWAVVGAAISFGALQSVNPDARLFVAFASVAFPLCAVGAAFVLRGGHDRAAGALLLASVATPTYFAYPLNLPALVLGAALLAAPGVVLGVSGRRVTGRP